ncbi:MAG TPA: AAA family ATPase [Streptosporangiaceae bacterium]|nr:AAA family ATPase [Streptosporangiaceae bacterium]
MTDLKRGRERPRGWAAGRRPGLAARPGGAGSGGLDGVDALDGPGLEPFGFHDLEPGCRDQGELAAGEVLAGRADRDALGEPLGGVKGRPRAGDVIQEQQAPAGGEDPRVLADMADVDALRKLRAAGVPALLYGPPGTGKTSLIEAAFPDLVTVAGDGDTTVADFVGEYTQNPDGTFAWIDGPLVVAMTEGRVLFIDDCTLISPAVLAVVYPAMDGRHEIRIKVHKGETVHAKDGFYVVGGHNPGVHGAVLTEALASRFAVQVQVSTDFDLARSLKIDPRAIRAAQNLATRKANGDIGWAPLAFRRIAEVLGDDAAIANLVGIAPEEDRDVVAQVAASVFGKPATPLALGRQI